MMFLIFLYQSIKIKSAEQTLQRTQEVGSLTCAAELGVGCCKRFVS